MKKLRVGLLLGICILLSGFLISTTFSSCSTLPRPFADYPNITQEDLGPDGMSYAHYQLDNGLWYIWGGVKSSGGGTSFGFKPSVRVPRSGTPYLYVLISFSDRDWFFMDRLYLWNAEGVELDLQLKDVDRRVLRGDEVSINERMFMNFSSYVDTLEQYLKGTDQRMMLYGRYKLELVMKPGHIKNCLELIEFYRFLLNHNQIDI